MKARVKCESITASQLQPGDLFSMVGDSYWKHALDNDSIGERVYIRTNTPSGNAPDGHLIVYRHTIEKVPDAKERVQSDNGSDSTHK